MHNRQIERRQQVEAIWRAGVAAVQPAHCVREAFLGRATNRQVVVIGGGKAGSAMAQAAETCLLEQGMPAYQITGWVNVPEGSKLDVTQHITLHPARPAGFNFPTPLAVAGTREMLEMVDNASDDAYILCLISGGGSALLCAPVPEVPLEDKLHVSQLLSQAGASIGELNTVRKHLSQFKGGQLAARCFSKPNRRQLISLIISDVMGDPLDVIASGPTAIDPTTFADALAVLERKSIRDRTPASVLHYLNAGAAGAKPETLKYAPASPEQWQHHLVASNTKAIEAAAQAAEALGYQVIEYVDQKDHDTMAYAAYLADQVAALPTGQRWCLLSGGETTVKLPANHGKGGRNQSMTLALLMQLRGLFNQDQSRLADITILCAGTDGEDGPTDAAGGFGDELLMNQANQKSLNPQLALQRHDAYPFLDACGGLFKTGLTDTNVMDLRVILMD
jgi:glycerate 2-kinase